ncbi:MAG: ligase 1 [Gaiellales bacterium]|nr:ligase 1 [Gaiellales bacterium]
MLLADLVATSAAVAATRSRLAKIAALADCLRRAGPGEVAIVVGYLSGELRQRRTGVGWAALRDLPAPAGAPALEVSEVDRAFATIEAAGGAGSARVRRDALAALFARATAEEQRFLAMLAGGELRQGALAGIVTDAVAAAAGIDAAAVRRAAMLAGDLPAVAEAALTSGATGLDAFHLQVGRPVQPMLAKTAPSLEAALETTGRAAVEWKLDGVRIQVHRDGDDVAVFTRTLDPVTERMPEIVEAVRALPLRTVILDGEAIALRPDGRPRPFQETASRAASRGNPEALREAVPLTAFFFDVLHLDGRDLLDLPGSERLAAIEPILPAGAWVPRLVTADAGEARAFSDDALARGHEGVVVKALSAPYEAGRRGAGWLKVKPVHTLDLVVLAAEWGHGRRQGLLSNLHLGARDPETNGFVMLGKTFKGLTDELLEWQTTRLLELEERRTASTVHVHPELIVEIAFDGIQTSSRYPGGMALRFARVIRYRPDKRAGESDTIATVRQLHEARGG